MALISRPDSRYDLNFVRELKNLPCRELPWMRDDRSGMPCSRQSFASTATLGCCGCLRTVRTPLRAPVNLKWPDRGADILTRGDHTACFQFLATKTSSELKMLERGKSPATFGFRLVRSKTGQHGGSDFTVDTSTRSIQDYCTEESLPFQACTIPSEASSLKLPCRKPKLIMTPMVRPRLFADEVPMGYRASVRDRNKYVPLHDLRLLEREPSALSTF